MRGSFLASGAAVTSWLLLQATLEMASERQVATGANRFVFMILMLSFEGGALPRAGARQGGS